jgi:cytochrome b involved in lipid metabolism
VLSVKHPGGDEILLEEGAKDATEAFEDVGHSPDARDMLAKYYIGEVDPEVYTPIYVLSCITWIHSNHILLP